MSNVQQNPQAAVDPRDAVILQLQAAVVDLGGRVDAQRHAATTKVPLPKKFDGTRGKLKGFLTSMDLYLRFNKATFVTEQDRVLAAGMNMEGDALEWFQPYMNDYLENHGADDTNEDTDQIFASYAAFRKKISAIYGEIDEERTAERKLRRLGQKGSAGKYTAEFRQVTAKLQWEDQPLIAQYYSGLKDRVKDEIARGDRPITLDDMIELAVRIDNRQYERDQEKKGASIPQTPRRRDPPSKKNDEDAMDIDKIETGGKGSRISKTELDRRYKQNACLYCGKQGHRRDVCPEKKPDVKVSVIRPVLTGPGRARDESETRLTVEQVARRLQLCECFLCGSNQHYPPDCSRRWSRVKMQGPGVQRALQEAMAKQATPETQFADFHTQEYEDAVGYDNDYEDNSEQLHNPEWQEPEAGPSDRAGWQKTPRAEENQCWLRYVDDEWNPETGKAEHYKPESESEADQAVEALLQHGPEQVRDALRTTRDGMLTRIQEIETERHDAIPWPECKKASCRPHQGKKRTTSWRPEDPYHGLLRTAECQDEFCRTHHEGQHAWMAWSKCYHDDCQTHLSSKVDSGYFPKRSAKN
jgi:hypothetical protein